MDPKHAFTTFIEVNDIKLRFYICSRRCEYRCQRSADGWDRQTTAYRQANLSTTTTKDFTAFDNLL